MMTSLRWALALSGLALSGLALSACGGGGSGGACPSGAFTACGGDVQGTNFLVGYRLYIDGAP